MNTVPFEALGTWGQLFASMWPTVVDGCLLLRSPEEKIVIRNMTCASIISTPLIEAEIF